jgi:ubiquinone/menaquinone biosynthesis C-methylase UbiE
MGGDYFMQKLFANPFHIEDLQIFDDDTLRRLLATESAELTIEQLAHSVHDAPAPLVQRIQRDLPSDQRSLFSRAVCHSLPHEEIVQAQREVLDRFFWELTYWKTPELYEEMTEGEHLHPGIFEQLEARIRDKDVLDVGAGSGRAALQCLRHGARLVYAVEPSPGLRAILQQKLAHYITENRLVLYAGRFEALPLRDNSIDMALSCSAFTVDPAQGGDAGLAEMKRVTRPGGQIILIWPRREDLAWLQAHGFHYVVLPIQNEMCVYFRSLNTALHCAYRFYARNQAVARYILTTHRSEVPFSLIGINPPCDYCWLEV